MDFPALYSAYAEYLERMFDESDDLYGVVDVFTVPFDTNMDALTEWCDVG